MKEHSTKADTDGGTLFSGEAWFDSIETGIRDRVRGFIEELLEQELTAALGGRSKHERAVEHHQGYRNGTRERQPSRRRHRADADIRAGRQGTDWNDYATQHQNTAVRMQFEAGLKPHLIKMPAKITPVEPRIATQAQRDAARARTPSNYATTATGAVRATQDAQLQRSRGPKL